MNTHALRRSLVQLVVGVSALALPLSVYAAADAATAPAAPAASSGLDECSKELLLSYFPQTYVNNSLKKFNIPEDKWAGINSTLASKDKEIVKMVEQKAAALNPNPLKDPQQRQAAVKLFRDTLFEVFSGALHDNGVQTDKQQAILDDIQQQKAKKFAECMERHKAQLDKNSEDDSSDADDEDDDEDDDDDTDASDNNAKSGNAASSKAGNSHG